MTYEEALKHFKNHEYMTDFSWQDEMSEIAITAIDKQIEKKPVLKKAEWDGQIYEICPICGEQIRIAGHMMAEYCCMCGQAIDWRKEN